MFTAINKKIPLIIIGKPGCSKSLSFQLLIKSMKGKCSINKFFKQYPSIIRSCFQGSITTTSKGVLNLFELAKKKLESFKNSKEERIATIFFDELGLAEKSKDNPLKVIHSYLEYDEAITIKNTIGFIGISNWGLDAAKMNRAIILYVPELDSSPENIFDSMESIVESINPDILKNYPDLFTNLSIVYFDFKKILKDNKSRHLDSISGRDFYHLIKCLAFKLNLISEKYKGKHIVNKVKIISSHIKIKLKEILQVLN